MENLADSTIHVKLRNKNNLVSRDDIIKKYQEAQIIGEKTQICRFYLRGTCIFSKENCKFAHGLSDLKFQKLELNMADYETQGENESSKETKPAKIQESPKIKQASLNLEMSYKCLFDTQSELHQLGIINNIYTLEEFHQHRSARHAVRSLLHARMTEEFLEMLFKIYSTNYLPKHFIEKCYASINWNPYWSVILHPKYCYESKIKQKTTYIVKLPDLKTVEANLHDEIIKIIEDNGFIDFLPVSSSVISKHHYKDIVKDNPLIPTLFIFTKLKEISLDHYFQKLQSNEEFLTKMMNRFPGKITKGTIIFDDISTDLKKFHEKVLKLIKFYFDESLNGILPYSHVESKILEECKNEVTQFNSNIGQIKRMIKHIALENKILVMNLLSSVILVSIEHFYMKGLCKQIVEEKCMITCKEQLVKAGQNIIKPMDESHYQHGHHHHHHHIIVNHKDNTPIPENYEKFDGDLDTQIDMKKVIIVDNPESLALARHHLSSVNEVGVDLEGSLEKDGLIELIQIGSQDKIFIFDMYQALLKAVEAANIDTNTKESNPKDVITDQVSSSSTILYEEMHKLIKEVMENPKILKIFHDCRKDSLALHLLADACPVNVMDVGALHVFSEHLKHYMRFENVLGLTETILHIKDPKKKKAAKPQTLAYEDMIQIQKALEQVKAPGLNDVFEDYNAPHGLNNLKKLMKHRFWTFPRSYFFQRPIDKEFLIYSAKDVEDLVAVKNNLVQKITEILTHIMHDIEHDKILSLVYYVSRTYSSYGCFHATGHSFM